MGWAAEVVYNALFWRVTHPMINIIPRKITGYRSKSINALIDCVKILYPLPSATIRREFTTGGVRLNVIKRDEGGSTPVRPFTITVSESTASITEGILQIGTVSYSVSGADISLSSSVEYIYVYHKKDHSSSGFGHSASIPNGAGDEWRFIIGKWGASGGTWVEVWNNNGNIIAIAPTA